VTAMRRGMFGVMVIFNDRGHEPGSRNESWQA
jgi:hypothetical protein